MFSLSSSKLQTLSSRFPLTHPGGKFVSIVVDSVLVDSKVDVVVSNDDDVANEWDSVVTDVVSGKILVDEIVADDVTVDDDDDVVVNNVATDVVSIFLKVIT